MLDLLIALATAQVAVPPAPVAPANVTHATATRRLQDVPGIKVTYHDLSEKDVKTIINALKKKKALSAAQQQLLAASTAWGVSPSVVKTTKGTDCTVTKAQIEFQPTADLPRFNEASVPAADQAHWRSYLAATEAQAAAKLWFAYDRLATFEQAVVGKPCDQAMTDGMAAINKLKAEAAAFKPAIETVQPAAVKSAAAPATQAPPPVQSRSGY